MDNLAKQAVKLGIDLSSVEILYRFKDNKQVTQLIRQRVAEKGISMAEVYRNTSFNLSALYNWEHDKCNADLGVAVEVLRFIESR